MGVGMEVGGEHAAAEVDCQTSSVRGDKLCLIIRVEGEEEGHKHSIHFWIAVPP